MQVECRHLIEVIRRIIQVVILVHHHLLLRLQEIILDKCAIILVVQVEVGIIKEEYGQQGGYSTSGSGFNPPMPPTSAYSQPFNSMGQSQPPPPPPLPPMPQQPQPMMNYDMYNNTSNMPFNNNSNQPPSSNYIQPLAQSYGQTQQQGFGTNSNGYGGGMSNPFNIPQQPSSGVGGYSDVSSPATSFDNSGSYGITSQNYSGGNYNNMPQQQSRGGGPMRGGRG
jgi:hypothetical protein